MNTIVTFIWAGERDYRPEHVAIMAEALKRRMTGLYRFVVVTDDPDADHGGAETFRTPDAAVALGKWKTPEASRFPSCYRRLWMFSKEACELGERVLMTDVDAVVVDDWAPLFRPDADFVGWHRPKGTWGSVERRVAGGMWLLRTGTMSHVYDQFVKDPPGAIARARALGFRGSDQAWISHKLADRTSACVWPAWAGIYSVRDFTRDDRRAIVRKIPADTRVVHFNGLKSPWNADAQTQHPWVKEFMP